MAAHSLINDDNPANIALMGNLLEAFGCRVQRAAGRAERWQAAQHEPRAFCGARSDRVIANDAGCMQ